MLCSHALLTRLKEVRTRCCLRPLEAFPWPWSLLSRGWMLPRRVFGWVPVLSWPWYPSGVGHCFELELRERRWLTRLCLMWPAWGVRRPWMTRAPSARVQSCLDRRNPVRSRQSVTVGRAAKERRRTARWPDAGGHGRGNTGQWPGMTMRSMRSLQTPTLCADSVRVGSLLSFSSPPRDPIAPSPSLPSSSF